MRKKALVTGASRGIGAATARELARAGFHVLINYHRSKEKALALAGETGGTALCADVSDIEQVRAMFAESGEVGALIINAAKAGFGLFTDTGYAEWRRLFAVNVDGAYNCLQCALPGMIREKSGSVVIISSVWGLRGASCEAAYSATKAALIGLTKSLAKELGPSGVRVNCVAPGVIDTDMNAGISEYELSRLASETPLGRIGTPEEIARLAAFLVSDEASFITGQVIGADGGFGL